MLLESFFIHKTFVETISLNTFTQTFTEYFQNFVGFKIFHKNGHIR
jgi:hypothetical protein